MVKIGDTVFYRFGTPAAGVVAKPATVTDVYDVAIDGDVQEAIALTCQLDRAKDSVHVPAGAECLDGETVTATDVFEGMAIGEWALTP